MAKKVVITDSPRPQGTGRLTYGDDKIKGYQVPDFKLTPPPPPPPTEPTTPPAKD